MSPWFIQNKDLYERFKQDINENYTTLNVTIENSIVFVRGTLRLKDKNGKEIDRYKIEIEIPSNYPNDPPVVKEIGRRLSKNPNESNPDRHMDAHNKCCLYFRDSTYKYWNKDSTILDFMRNVVEGFFVWQTEYELTGGKNSDEAWGHGCNGIIEYYGKIVGTSDIKTIYQFMDYLSKKKVKGHWPCFCDSGKKIKECHINLLKEYKGKIRRKDVQKSLNDLIRLAKK